jgi:hypothetical protein
MEKAILKRESVKDSVLSYQVLSQKENEKGLEFIYEVITSSESGKVVVRKDSIYLDKTGDGLFVESIK